MHYMHAYTHIGISLRQLKDQHTQKYKYAQTHFVVMWVSRESVIFGCERVKRSIIKQAGIECHQLPIPLPAAAGKPQMHLGAQTGFQTFKLVCLLSQSSTS